MERAALQVIIKSILSRLLFLGHSIAAIYMYTNSKLQEPIYWFLVIPPLLLVIESLVTVYHKKGVEMKYFWPSGFLYITSIIGVIWLVQIDLFEERISQDAEYKIRVNYTLLTTFQQRSIDVELYGVAFHRSNSSLLKKICELGLILGIFIGRWLMPRGSLTKDQLSALLLTQVGNSADILELLKGIEEFEVFNDKTIVYAIIGLFTLSVYQFALITTATLKSGNKSVVEDVEKSLGRTGRIGLAFASGGKELTLNKDIQKTYIEDLRSRAGSVATPEIRGRGRKSTTGTGPQVPINRNSPLKTNSDVKMRDIHGEVFQIMVTLFMQDGPYLILRIYLWMDFNISHEMHIFFIAKNAIVCILLIYRLLVLSCSGEDEESTWHRELDEWKLRNVQLAHEDIYTNISRITVK